MSTPDAAILTAPALARSEPTQRTAANTLYRSLAAQLAAAGCFRLAPRRAVLYALGVLGAYTAAYALLLTAPAPGWRVVAAAALAFVSVHAGFIAHEAGHGALTRSGRLVSVNWAGVQHPADRAVLLVLSAYPPPAPSALQRAGP